MSIHVVDFGSIKVKIKKQDRAIVIPGPAESAHRRTVTRLRFNNNDSQAITPKFEVFDSDANVAGKDMDYVRLYPELTSGVPTKGRHDDCASPVYVLGPTEAITLELDVDPTDDDDSYPTVIASWIDQVIA